MKWTLFAALVAAVRADVYLHHPRGSNDRCDELSNDRNNGNRLFRSDNNAAGGYAVADQSLSYYEGTDLRIEWMAQHGCGQGSTTEPLLAHCETVIQVGCEDTFQRFAGAQQSTYRLTDGQSLGRLCADRPAQDGCLTAGSTAGFTVFGNTCTQRAPTTYVPPGANPLTVECPGGFTPNATCDALDLSQGTTVFNSATCQCSTRKQGTYAMHEPENWYHLCRTRPRNGGLFTADQNLLLSEGADVTRQDPVNTRHGFECSEERDYWPYWAPTPWRDLAVVTSNTSLCADYQQASQNVASRCLCVARDGGDLSPSTDALGSDQAQAWAYGTPATCQGAGYVWKCFSSWNWNAPECLLAPYQTDNRLGNADGHALASYTWRIPAAVIPQGQDQVACVLRVRYNISSAEVPRTLDARSNGRLVTNPVRTYGAPVAPLDATQTVLQTLPLRHALNTAQYGRTFQDRTYVFVVQRRPEALTGATIHNLGVRGKRGNIAQVRNCVEYDFVPSSLQVAVGDYVHVQWAGSDYNPQGNAGEGRAGTDRSNLVQVALDDSNLLVPMNQSGSVFSTEDTAALAWVGQDPAYCLSTQQMLGTSARDAQNPLSCHFLNGARTPGVPYLPTAYFSRLVQVIQTGTFHYISTRNNNFSNRSQKGVIVANDVQGLSAGAVAGIVIGVFATLMLLFGVAWLLVVKKVGIGRFTTRV